MEQKLTTFAPSPRNRRYWITYWLAVVVLWIVQVYSALALLVVKPTGQNLTQFMKQAVVSLVFSAGFVAVVGGFCFATVWGVRKLSIRIKRWLFYIGLWTLGVSSAFAFIAVYFNGYTLVKPTPTAAQAKPSPVINFSYPVLPSPADLAMETASNDAVKAAAELQVKIDLLLQASEEKWAKDGAEVSLIKAETEVASNPSRQAIALKALLPRARTAIQKVDGTELARLSVELGKIR